MRFNEKQIISVVGVVVAFWIIQISGGSGIIRPTPTPPNPEPQPIPAGIAQIAANDAATYLNALSENFSYAAQELRTGKLASPDDAHKWLEKANTDVRIESFQPLYAELNKPAQEKDSQKLAEILDQAAIGFKSLIGR